MCCVRVSSNSFRTGYSQRLLWRPAGGPLLFQLGHLRTTVQSKRSRSTRAPALLRKLRRFVKGPLVLCACVILHGKKPDITKP